MTDRFSLDTLKYFTFTLFKHKHYSIDLMKKPSFLILQMKNQTCFARAVMTYYKSTAATF